MATKAAEPGTSNRKTVLIVDDHPVLRRGLAALIESEPDLAVGAEATTCRDALETMRTSRPDLAIVDLALKGCDGLDLIKAMKARHPETPALVLSMHDESAYAERCLRAGARGYVSKQQLDETVLVAIRRLLDGEIYMSNELASRLALKHVGRESPPGDSPLDALSDRQLQVFRMIGQGQSTREIAQSLGLSVKTIESHREHIKNKLTIGPGTELVRRAIRWVETGRAG